MSPVTTPQPPIGHVHLVLYPPQSQSPNAESEEKFYLEIPVSFIEQHYRSPLKFLLYLGWCILGTHGDLRDSQRREVRLDGQLLKRGTYYFQPKETDNIFKYAVDLEVIQARSAFKSSASSSRDSSFPVNLRERDGVCVFTGGDFGMKGIHIIPHRKGDEWLELIIANRPNDEPVIDMNGIDDIQNGMICCEQIHVLFDLRKALILKTPNPVLEEDDVAPRCQRYLPIPPSCSYPSDSRHTFQLFETPTNATDRIITPDNNDATFLTSSMLPKPSGLLLNYNYGAVAVKRWGRNISIFSKRPGILRPKVVTPAMGPTKTLSPANHEKSAKKRKLRETGGQEEAGASGTAEEMQDSDQEWDEDDVMLYFWGNSRAARERYESKQQDRKDFIEDWKSSVLVE
ncbi:hypothetical protein M422DRAFT_35730 [Sphaerobolus stellatus SS14]|uniref:HNH nuclease domain-containing protein n=1 Tax=Sphaerobolus stellatus (strain SS14) TaxID=990650 RepID=A0A0C9UTV8_SPHS4|nr:hypothetical protein M422DRAFT_35730 [Sphaerobolus stellatus SS14]